MAPSSFSKEALRADPAPCWEAGAKAAAEPTRRKAIVFIMVDYYYLVFKLVDKK